MNRFWLLLTLLLAFGCSSQTAKPPGADGSADEPAAASEETPPPADPLTPDFEPTKTTPITTGTPEPKFPKQAVPSKVELTVETKQAIANLVHADAKVKDQAQATLDQLDGKTIDILLAAAKDASADVRAGAMYGLLGRFNQFDERMMATVIQGLGDSNERVRGIALVGAGDMPGELLEPAVNELASILANKSEPAYTRAAAARLLSKLSSTAFAPLQKALLNDKDRSVRLACLKGIVATAPSPAEASFALTKTLDDPHDAQLRRAAAVQLGELGSAAATAVPALIAALGDSDARVAKAAADALVRIGGPSVSLLADAAASGEKPVRLLALGALFQLGPVASASKAQLEQAAQDSDAEIQAAVAAALQSVSQ
jgi:HEAT repeat protein